MIVPALSLEIVSGSVLNGESKGETITVVIPGIHLWHPYSGWAFGLGAEVPVSQDRPSDYGVLLQIGNHLRW